MEEGRCDPTVHGLSSKNHTNLDSGAPEPYSGRQAQEQPQNGEEKSSVSYLTVAGQKVYETGKSVVSGTKKRILGQNEKPFAVLISPEEGADVTRKKLENLFKNVKDKPVAIYSISGAFRKGKSFLLNLFIKYLEKLEAGNGQEVGHNWMDAKNNALGGFSWRGGMEPNTQGILIYSKPFVIKNLKGRKTAVFLMDTQGLFDSDSSMTKCSSIFALSTLISSMQIYNLSQQIQEDNLQYLQLFTDYGRALHEIATSNKNQKPFQHLMFLIRDWPHESEGFGWEGGKKVLTKILVTKKSADDDLKSVRKYIMASFETVECFLMPHPGREIASRKDGDNTFEPHKMDEMFRAYVDSLARDLFSPQRLALKRIGGKEGTCGNMIDLISGMLHNFNPKTAPHISTLFQSAAEHTATNTLEECDDFCEQLWNDILKVSERVGG
uniref:Atlastin-2 n=1 Tax=Phallusia mammillata TaxID=59560 RepID=A0A6F9D6I7_9ASCI|nr:atlastin-2 [Phallusia mammillata]